MLPKTHRLRHERDFARLSVKGRPFYGPFCTLRACKSDSHPSKVGFVASGKIFKLAVDRNRARRRMSEIIRVNLDKVPAGFDLTFIAKPDIKKAEFEALRNSMLLLLAKMPGEMARPQTRRFGSPQRSGTKGVGKIGGPVTRPFGGVGGNRAS